MWMKRVVSDHHYHSIKKLLKLFTSFIKGNLGLPKLQKEACMALYQLVNFSILDLTKNRRASLVISHFIIKPKGQSRPGPSLSHLMRSWLDNGSIKKTWKSDVLTTSGSNFCLFGPVTWLQLVRITVDITWLKFFLCSVNLRDCRKHCGCVKLEMPNGRHGQYTKGYTVLWALYSNCK